MSNIVLISRDERIIGEVSTAAAVIEASLSVYNSCNESEPSESDTVLVDAQCDGTLTHSRIAIVCFGPAGPQEWMAASLRGAHRIIELPDARTALTEFINSTNYRHSRTIAITSIVRGVGTSTLAIAIASQVAKRGFRTLLLDADPDGGLDVLAGIENAPGARWNEIVKHGSKGLTLPETGGFQLLSSDLRANRIVPVASCAQPWVSAAEMAIWDVPPASADAVAELKPDVLCTVVPNTVRATTAAKRNLDLLPGVECGLIVRSVPGASLEPMDVAEITGVPLWAVIPSDVRVVEQVEQGLGPATINLGGYTRAVVGLVDRLVRSAPDK